MTIFFRLFVAISGLVLSVQTMATSPLPVPTVESHKEFLVGEWKPNSPSVVLFTDPFCPYCLKALEKKHELDNVNLFMFWYPIFGEKSDSRVAEFFRCNSPVGSNVIESVLQRKSPDCTRKLDTKLESKNKQMYEAYNPPGVPAFYLGGQKVSFAEVKSIQVEERLSSGVNLEWERYSVNQILNNSATGTRVAFYLSSTLSERKVREIAEILKSNEEYRWYLFPSKANQLSKRVCSILQLSCIDDRDKLLQSGQEIALLYGLDHESNSQVIIDGRLTSVEHLPTSLQPLSRLIR